MTLDRLCDQLSATDCARLLVISPAQDGSPRRGCEDPNCPAVRGVEQMLTPTLSPNNQLRKSFLARENHDNLCSAIKRCSECEIESTPTRPITAQRPHSMIGVSPLHPRNQSGLLSSINFKNYFCKFSSSPNGGIDESIAGPSSASLSLNPPRSLNRAQSDEHLTSGVLLSRSNTKVRASFAMTP